MHKIKTLIIGSLRFSINLFNDDYAVDLEFINVEDISALYKSYLFGYTLKLWAEEENGDSQDVKNIKGVPPWCIAHCRLFTTDKDFFPFGKPLFLSAIPTFKSYKTTQLLIDMLRSQSFPREHYSIKCDENSDPFTRNMRISEAKNFLEGITPQTQNQDGLSVGSKIYSCEGLVDYDLLVLYFNIQTS